MTAPWRIDPLSLSQRQGRTGGIITTCRSCRRPCCRPACSPCRWPTCRQAHQPRSTALPGNVSDANAPPANALHYRHQRLLGCPNRLAHQLRRCLQPIAHVPRLLPLISLHACKAPSWPVNTAVQILHAGAFERLQLSSIVRRRRRRVSWRSGCSSCLSCSGCSWQAAWRIPRIPRHRCAGCRPLLRGCRPV